MLNNVLYSVDIEQISHVIDTDHFEKKLFVENSQLHAYQFDTISHIEEKIKEKGVENMRHFKIAQLPMSLFDINDYR